MGLFSWFSKPKRVEQLSDLIWLTRDEKFRGIVKEIKERLDVDDGVLVVAHFPQEFQKITDALQDADIAFHADQLQWNSQDISRIARRGERLPYVVLAETLPDSLPGSSSNNQFQLVDESSSEISILVAERHPIPPPDDHILRFAEGLPYRSRLRYFLSIDDPLLKTFAGEWVRGVLSRLGMEEGDSIESNMVSRRVQGIQKTYQERFDLYQESVKRLAIEFPEQHQENLRNIAREFPNGIPKCESAEEWMNRNGLNNLSEPSA